MRRWFVIVLCSQIRTELMEARFKSFRIDPFTLWVCFHHALQPGPNWTHGGVWGCISNRLELHLRCEGVIIMLCCRVQTELMGRYFKSIRMSFTLWRCHYHALQPGPNWTRGDVFQIRYVFIYAVKVSLSCSACGFELNSWGCISNPSEFHVNCEGVLYHALQPGLNWTHGDVFQIP